ncbi:hypothetical protein ES332_A03G081400v1 [Gossypium tomentosum]|uniref:Uncharacterized protein n=1 Tax=Gossypium tomentosum TaxID=34277 RepID=A0A5D2R719_GOSTO|nr:hypothetical protein ES332_A03G081400v1 [Gossypium tomentosum]
MFYKAQVKRDGFYGKYLTDFIFIRHFPSSKTFTKFFPPPPVLHLPFPSSSRDKSASGHSLTVRETITVTRAEIEGATAYEVTAAGNHRSKMGICLAANQYIAVDKMLKE